MPARPASRLPMRCRRGPCWPVCYRRQAAWMKRSRIAKAAVDMLHREDARAHGALGTVYVKMNDGGSALAAFERMAHCLVPEPDRLPSSPWVSYAAGRGIALSLLGRHDDAMAAFEDVLRADHEFFRDGRKSRHTINSRREKPAGRPSRPTRNRGLSPTDVARSQSRRSGPQLQIPTVARPRNQSWSGDFVPGPLTHSLARRFAGSLRSRGALALARAFRPSRVLARPGIPSSLSRAASPARSVRVLGFASLTSQREGGSPSCRNHERSADGSRHEIGDRSMAQQSYDLRGRRAPGLPSPTRFATLQWDRCGRRVGQDPATRRRRRAA